MPVFSHIFAGGMKTSFDRETLDFHQDCLSPQEPVTAHDAACYFITDKIKQSKTK